MKKTKKDFIQHEHCIRHYRYSSFSLLLLTILIATLLFILTTLRFVDWFDRPKEHDSLHSDSDLLDHIPTLNADVILPISTTKKRVVILAGPGKTASSSIQFNLHKWSEEGLLGDTWKWVTPHRKCVCAHDTHCTPLPSKAWRSLGTCLENVLMNPTNTWTSNCTQLQSCYQDALLQQEARMEKKKPVKFVFGIERIVRSILTLQVYGPDPKTPVQYMQRFLDVLPPTIQREEVVLVVTYRAPRIDHLISQWKQIRDDRNPTLSLRDYLHSDLFYFYNLDPLYATKIIVEDYGVDVIVLDSSGISWNGYDISNVIACQILRVPCHQNNITLKNGGNESLPAIRNSRIDDPSLNDLTEEEKTQLESILRKLDCNSIDSMFDHARIQLLHPHRLKETRNLCALEVNRTFYTHEQAQRDIRFAVRSVP